MDENYDGLIMEELHRNNKIVAFIVVLLAVCAFVCYGMYENNALTVSRYEIDARKNDRNGDCDVAVRAVHISDFHNARFGKDNARLIEFIKEQKPDVIFITGDHVDSVKTNTEISLAFSQDLLEIAPVFYVTGNHEHRLGDVGARFVENLSEAGITVLMNSTAVFEKNGCALNIVGLKDPDFYGDEPGCILANLETIMPVDGFNVVLSHRPERFDEYVKADADLVLCGHAHGGQFRLPRIGGVFAPEQGFFPEYDAGIFQKDGTKMIVSRGLGNSIIPVRIGNRPEVVVVDFLY